jgi:flagellar protein FliO/FliZ
MTRHPGRMLSVSALALAATALTPALAWAESAAPVASAAPSAAASAAPAAAPAAASAAVAAPPAAPTPAVAAVATAATPLNVRPSHPVTYAADPVGAGFGWKLGLLGLALAGGWFLWKRRAPVGSVAAPKIRIVARQAVGVRSEILIVEIEGDRLLLGVTPQSIARIGDLPPAEPEAEASVEPDPRARPAAVAARAQELAREFERARGSSRDAGREGREPPGGNVGARISALLGNPGGMVPAPVIATRGASVTASGRGRKSGRNVDYVVDDEVDVGDAHGGQGGAGHVEEQARGLLRAARRP